MLLVNPNDTKIGGAMIKYIIVMSNIETGVLTLKLYYVN